MDTAIFLDTARKKGHLKGHKNDLDGVYSEDFRLWLTHIGYSQQKVERSIDKDAARFVVTYEHPSDDAPDIVVRHVAHEEGSRSFWRLG